jgi:exopolysaccharide biosynthesis predicted pyruvyltransferase EpsI
MAFALEVKPCRTNNNEKNVLFVKRHDKESPLSYDGLGLTDCDISDWPTINKPLLSMRFAKFCSKAIIKGGRILHLPEDNLIRLSQWVSRISWHHIIKRQLIKSGISFLSPYQVIYAPRLHAGILAYMLGQDVVLIDNPNHKLKNFFDTWFKDVSSVKLIELSEYRK